MTRKEQAEQTKKSIIKTTQKLLLNADFKEIQIRDICAMCNISSGNFYNYFPSKQHIIPFLIEEIEEEFVFQFSNEKSIDDIYKLFLNYAKIIDKISKKMISELHQLQLITNTRIILSPNHRLYQSLIDIFTDLENSSKIEFKTTKDQVVINLLIVYRGYIFKWMTDDNDATFYDMIKDIFSIYIDAFVKQK